MKVLLVTIDREGLSHYSAQLVDALAERCDAILVSPAGTGCYVSGKAGVIEIDYPQKRWNPAYFLKLLSLVRIIAREKPDVVHIQDMHPLLCVVSSLIPGTKIVQTLHDVTPHMGEQLWYSRWSRNAMMKRADAIIVHGNYLRNILLKLYPEAEDKTHVVHLGPWNLFRRWSNADTSEEKNLLFFGRIVGYKGIEVLLRAMNLVHNVLPEYRLTIAGRAITMSEDLSECEGLIREYKDFVDVDNRRIPDEEVPKLFERCQMVVLPYLDGSQSGVLSMAYAFNKPVIATSVGSIPETVEHGNTGLLVPPGDVQALADAIIQLANDSNMRSRMKVNIEKKVIGELSWDSAAEKTINVYRKINEENASFSK